MTIYKKKPAGNSHSIDKGFDAVDRHFWATLRERQKINACVVARLDISF
jgi:hypothetical protein